MKRLVLIDPEAPSGCRPAPRGVVVNGQVIKSPAMKRLVDNLVRDQVRWAERERREAAWAKRQMAAAPPLTVRQVQMLRRVKTDLTRQARQRPPAPPRTASG